MAGAVFPAATVFPLSSLCKAGGDLTALFNQLSIDRCISCLRPWCKRGTMRDRAGCVNPVSGCNLQQRCQTTYVFVRYKYYVLSSNARSAWPCSKFPVCAAGTDRQLRRCPDGRNVRMDRGIVVKEGDYVAVFNSVHRVLKAEKILKEAGSSFALIPAPRQISADCGLALCFAPEARAEIVVALNQADLPIAALWMMQSGGYRPAE